MTSALGEREVTQRDNSTDRLRGGGSNVKVADFMYLWPLVLVHLSVKCSIVRDTLIQGENTNKNRKSIFKCVLTNDEYLLY